MINSTALTACFKSPSFTSQWEQGLDYTMATRVPCYIVNKHGKIFLRVSMNDGQVQVTHKNHIVKRSVWIRAIIRAGYRKAEPEAINVPMLLQRQAG